MIIKFGRAKAHNWLGIKTYAQSSIKIGAPLDKFGNPSTGLTSREEEAEMEQKLDLAPGTLAKTSDFWSEFYVQIDDKTLELDTSIPEHELWYKFLKSQKKVAKSKAELRTNATAQFVLYSEEEEAKVENKGFKAKSMAYALVNEMSPADMRQVLLFYGKSGNSTNDETVANMIYKEVDMNPSKFLEIVQDDKLKLKAFILELVRYGVLSKRGTSFVYGDDTLSHDLEGMVKYLETKDNAQMLKHFKEELKYKK
jgi:hypothetical protein